MYKDFSVDLFAFCSVHTLLEGIVEMLLKIKTIQ